jgi:hypothetical protein
MWAGGNIGISGSGYPTRVRPLPMSQLQCSRLFGFVSTPRKNSKPSKPQLNNKLQSGSASQQRNAANKGRDW